MNSLDFLVLFVVVQIVVTVSGRGMHPSYSSYLRPMNLQVGSGALADSMLIQNGGGLAGPYTLNRGSLA